MKTKKCCKCKKLLPIKQFHKATRSKDGHRECCKECRKSEPYRIAPEYRIYNCRRARERKIKFHGLYGVWNTMKQRCTNPNTISFKYYGFKGVTVCEEWKESFEAFYSWCMAHGYKKGLQLDRITSNGNYSPVNCRFISAKENSRNDRKQTKLNIEKVKVIKKLIAEGKTNVQISRLFDVVPSNIDFIKKGATWSDVKI